MTLILGLFSLLVSVLMSDGACSQRQDTDPHVNYVMLPEGLMLLISDQNIDL